jgi:tetratricopeptide (TPR) repeat protein
MGRESRALKALRPPIEHSSERENAASAVRRNRRLARVPGEKETPLMIRSIRKNISVLACLLATLTTCGAVAADDPPKPEVKPAPAPEGRRDDPTRFYLLFGGEIPGSFVPVQPRTVEDRKAVEATTAFAVARALEDRGSSSDAIGLLEDALKAEPDSITVLRRLSQLCFVVGRTEVGINYCKKVLAADPGDVDTIARLVKHYNRRNDPTAAETVLKDVLANPKLEKHAAGRVLADLELGKLYSGKLMRISSAADAFARVIEALDSPQAKKFHPSDIGRILGQDEAASYLEFGLVFLQAKRFDLAVKAFERGLDYEPDNPQIPLLLAQTLLKLDKGEEALAFVDRFLKRQPQGIEGYELQAKVLTALKRENEITPRLEEAAKRDSKNVVLQYALADRYRETGQAARADAMYKQLLTEQPTTQGFGAYASSLLKQKKAEELLKVLSTAIRKPGGFEAVQDAIKGIIDDPAFGEQVIEAGKKLLDAEPPGLDAVGLRLLAEIAKGTNKLANFLPLQLAELKRRPTPQTYRESIDWLEKLRKFGEAATLLEEMTTKYPGEKNLRQLSVLAALYRLAEKPEDAIRAAREALKLDPNDYDAQMQLAVLLSQTGKLPEAVEMLEAAVKRDPNNPGPAMILGMILTTAGKNDEAIKLLKGVLEKFPNNDEVVAQARQHLSIVYVNLGDYAKGEAELEAILERTPDEPGVNNDLGYLYAEQGKNLEKAEVMIRKALADKPDNYAYLDSLGWVLFKQGKLKEAVEPLERAAKQIIEVSANDATIFEHLGDVYFQLKDVAKARSAWQTAEKAASKSNPPDKRLPEIRKKLESLEKISFAPKPSTGATP